MYLFLSCKMLPDQQTTDIPRLCDCHHGQFSTSTNLHIHHTLFLVPVVICYMVPNWLLVEIVPEVSAHGSRYLMTSAVNLGPQFGANWLKLTSKSWPPAWPGLCLSAALLDTLGVVCHVLFLFCFAMCLYLLLSAMCFCCASDHAPTCHVSLPVFVQCSTSFCSPHWFCLLACSPAFHCFAFPV